MRSPGEDTVLPLDHTTFARVTSGRPEWARARAERGLAAYERLDMPDPKLEDWRYVEVPSGLPELPIVAAPGGPLQPDADVAGALGGLAGRAVVVDGATVGTEHEGRGTFLSLADAVSEGTPGVEEALAAGVQADLDKFAAAHVAFGTDGVFLHVPDGEAIRAPFLIDLQAVTPGSVSFPRVTVLAGDGAQASVVVLQRSPDGVPVTVVPHFDVIAGDDASVSITTVQQFGDQTTAVAHQRMVAARDAAVALSEFGVGGSSARMHLTIDLAGRGADARVLGLYFGELDQTLDYRAFVNHQAPNTTSEMFLKGAVADHSRSVFTGLIRIEPEGQKTNAHQTNRNLVLSDGAEAHSVPNLEILANDVRCGHGSAVGPLDEEQRYYLMSRGIERGRADRLQVKGFFEEVLTRFPAASLEPPLRRVVMAKYDRVVAREAS
jgi:Fe-S cluster assembly protein SufD